MLRALLFALSRSRIGERIATSVPGFRGFSRRFVAGRTQADALDAVARLNADGFAATVSFLGEAVTSEREVRAAIDEFTSFAQSVRTRALRSAISVKLTELGLSFDRALAARSLDTVLTAAAAAGVFVRIDMEDSHYTQTTLEMFEEARLTHDNVGIVIQAYLRRSRDDIDRLAAADAPVRLVKGAYREPESVAAQAKVEVDALYLQLVERYFARTSAGRLAVATHDARMIRGAIAAAARHNVARDRIEFQMLYGIRPELQRSLRDRKYAVRVYVPYGSHWYPYLMRRLAERPANLWFFLRSAIRR